MRGRNRVEAPVGELGPGHVREHPSTRALAPDRCKRAAGHPNSTDATPGDQPPKSDPKKVAVTPRRPFTALRLPSPLPQAAGPRPCLPWPRRRRSALCLIPLITISSHRSRAAWDPVKFGKGLPGLARLQCMLPFLREKYLPSLPLISTGALRPRFCSCRDVILDPLQLLCPFCSPSMRLPFACVVLRSIVGRG